MAKKRGNGKGKGSGTIYPRKNKDGKIIGYRGSYVTPEGADRMASRSTSTGRGRTGKARGPRPSGPSGEPRGCARGLAFRGEAPESDTARLPRRRPRREPKESLRATTQVQKSKRSKTDAEKK
jgi:hypothetical protein